MDVDVSPEIAAIVVEKYLLPMFDADHRIHLTKKRLETTGKSSPKPQSAICKTRNN